MGSQEDQHDDTGWRDSEDFIPGPLRTGASFREMVTANDQPDGTAGEGKDNIDEEKDGAVDRKTELREKHARHGGKTRDKHRLRRRPTEDPLSDWSWLSEESPLMSSKSESEWILEGLSATLVRELNRQRKGHKRHPPVSMKHLARSKKLSEKAAEEAHAD